MRRAARAAVDRSVVAIPCSESEHDRPCAHYFFTVRCRTFARDGTPRQRVFIRTFSSGHELLARWRVWVCGLDCCHQDSYGESWSPDDILHQDKVIRTCVPTNVLMTYFDASWAGKNPSQARRPHCTFSTTILPESSSRSRSGFHTWSLMPRYPLMLAADLPGFART